jgi:hypothetical protein
MRLKDLSGTNRRYLSGSKAFSAVLTVNKPGLTRSN